MGERVLAEMGFTHCSRHEYLSVVEQLGQSAQRHGDPPQPSHPKNMLLSSIHCLTRGTVPPIPLPETWQPA